jgi:hypothetical protein
MAEYPFERERHPPLLRAAILDPQGVHRAGDVRVTPVRRAEGTANHE